MSIFFYREIPEYHMNKFRAVRDCLDNLSNILQLVEIVNHCQSHLTKNKDDGFDIAVFTKNFQRFLVKIGSSYVSMAIPFQIIIEDENISFNCDYLQEPVNGKLISILRNAIETSKNNFHSHEDIIISLTDNFDLTISDATAYYDTFVSLIADDHGYFRFDDDPEHENGDIHPRYHFDIFYKNTTSLKIGYNKLAQIDCFISLSDKKIPKKYLYDKA